MEMSAEPTTETAVQDHPGKSAIKPDLTGPVVVRSPNWLGDALMTLPAVRNLKKMLGDAPLTVATPAKLTDLWSSAPFVDRVMGLKQPKSLFDTAKQLRAEKFGDAILLTNSFRTAAEAALARIPVIVGYPGHSRRWLLKHVVERSSYTSARAHQKYHYIDLISSLGAPEDDTFPTLRRPQMEQRLDQVSLFPGAEYGPAKRWPPSYFCEIARRFRDQRQAKVIIMGARKDCPIAAEITAQLPWVENRTGQTSLAEVMTEISRSRLVLCNDSGAMHLASALGVPTVAVFGSTEPSRTGPLGPHNAVLRRHVPCSPCFLRNCPLDFACMITLTPGIAWPVCLRLWDATAS